MKQLRQKVKVCYGGRKYTGVCCIAFYRSALF